MKKFMALYMAPSAAMEQMMKDSSLEDMKTSMKLWEDWMEENMDSIVDRGDPLGKTKRVSKEGATDAKNEICGYTIVLAESYDEAVKLFGSSHPHFYVAGATIEIMEIVPMPSSE